ncbi:MAG: PIG-L deacetylase family protein [Candidatus Woesearchaeota archaeon]|jgi:LmbE family N-acetylglucosaminyl deacetylase|nr:PIG-L deacetylase family protein [Candidatus Woesearchaeota archaeon]MDP7198932.1 PIG-L deacetylase family protein [Candidatus Woesearchaeota archaeon]MDP7467310.1 PIG-L deacetylase family protein [Candidatus Woesearchaeota archaeon]MDP7646635.1 PIG-L deacetylase family protein [Candidatus Woesearchaeota archaeon]
MVHTLVICAHNDDQIVGAGGTLAKEAAQGKSFKTVIFSYGELSHPHLKPDVVVQKRKKEGIKGDRLLGSKCTGFLELPEGKFLAHATKAKRALAQLIRKEKPKRVFTHSPNDLHRDHQAVFSIVQSLRKSKVLTCPVYSFEVWTLLPMRQRKQPKLVVDVSNHFHKKMKAFFVHESQLGTILSLTWKLYIMNRIDGLRYGFKFAEVFRRV